MELYGIHVWHRQAWKSSENDEMMKLMIVSKQAEMSYEELLTKFKMQTLEKRREKLYMDFGRTSLI